ncbi:MAG: VOC family protein [Terriglobales bacterium]
MLRVQSVEASIAFYALLGFELVDKMGAPECLGWARMHCKGGALMFLRAEEPADEGAHALSCMYTPDLPALRAHLAASGIAVPEIRYPDYLPAGEVQIQDPDGNQLALAQWGPGDDERWERERGERLAR